MSLWISPVPWMRSHVIVQHAAVLRDRLDANAPNVVTVACMRSAVCRDLDWSKYWPLQCIQKYPSAFRGFVI
jgi:hypothetical protein